MHALDVISLNPERNQKDHLLVMHGTMAMAMAMN
jgi:hypothetical protein